MESKNISYTLVRFKTEEGDSSPKTDSLLEEMKEMAGDYAARLGRKTKNLVPMYAIVKEHAVEYGPHAAANFSPSPIV